MKYSPIQRDSVTLYNFVVKENLQDKADPNSGSFPALNQGIYVLTESIGSKVIVFIYCLSDLSSAADFPMGKKSWETPQLAILVQQNVSGRKILDQLLQDCLISY